MVQKGFGSIIATLMVLFLGMLVPQTVQACSPVEPELQLNPTPENFEKAARETIRERENVIRVFALTGGYDVTFLVLRPYKGTFGHFEVFSKPVLQGSLCGPGPLNIFQSYVLAFDDNYESIGSIVAPEVERIGIEKGIWQKQNSRATWLLWALGFAAFLLLVWLSKKFVQLRKSRQRRSS